VPPVTTATLFFKSLIYRLLKFYPFVFGNTGRLSPWLRCWLAVE
jgi:hypothetical protein